MMNMSEDYYGQPFGPAIRFGLCDRCNDEPPTWMVSRVDENNQTIVSFLCELCYEVSASGLSAVTTEIENENESEERPTWMEDFIKEQPDSLQTIGTEIDATYADAPEEFTVEAERYTNEGRKGIRVAKWATAFIQEALFGPNPKGWLEKQNAYTIENIDQTVHTLTSFTKNQTGAVKLSALKCLEPILQTGTAEQQKIVQATIQELTTDADDTVAALAKSLQ